MSLYGSLEEIELDGFLSIKSMKLELDALNLMIGPNGAGKSNLIAFFRFMNKLVQKDLQIYVAKKGGADALLHYGLKHTKSISTRLKFSPNGYRCKLVPSLKGGFVFEEESGFFYGSDIGYHGGIKMEELAAPGDTESGLPAAGWDSIGEHVARYLSDWKVYHFHDTSETAAVKQARELHDNRRLREQGDNLAAFLYAIRDTDAYRNIVGMVQRAAPFFHDFDLAPDVDNPQQIRLRWKHRGTDAYFGAAALSDGTLRFICLTTLLLQPNLPTMILLDEPELGLHPHAVQLLASMMRSASRKTQIIASTQSVTLANEFGYQDLIIVEQKDGESRFRRLEESQVSAWLNDYRMGDLWEKNLLGGNPE